MQDAKIRLGADIGGTFTDVVLEAGAELYSTKVLTTYAAPETAIIEGFRRGGLDVGDRDGLATFEELAVYVKGKVEKATDRQQRPQFDNLSREDGSFLFVIE